MVPPDKKRASRRGARGSCFAVPPSFSLSTILAGTASHAIPRVVITLPLRQSLLGLQTFRFGAPGTIPTPAQVSAHTLPDSLNLAWDCTIPVQRLCRIRLGGIVVRPGALVKSARGNRPKRCPHGAHQQEVSATPRGYAAPRRIHRICRGERP